MTTGQNWRLEDKNFASIWAKVEPHTMTSVERGYALYKAVQYICDRPLNGNIVESGVWKGGSSMLIALTLVQLGQTHRNLYLFDTYSGMPAPQDVDIDLRGSSAESLLERDKNNPDDSLIWAKSDRGTVEQNMASTGYPADRVHFIEGDVTEAAGRTRTGALSLLRLDTDWYSSTKAELTQFWPRLNQHGILLVDDYGHWQGAKKAVDEFFGHGSVQSAYLQPIDYTGRLIVRSTVNEAIPPGARYDHVPAGFEVPNLMDRYPELEPTDPRTCPEPKLRKSVPHIWRTDTREDSRSTGVLSVEEAAILFTLAKTRTGRRGLEIGSHFGWSTAHLAAAGLKLDAIDPAFGAPERSEQVSQSLSEWIDTGAVHLWPGYSPGILPAVFSSSPEKYGFAFIDGLHHDGGPLRDVKGVLEYLADDAMIAFHDLNFPDVASAVRYLKGEGWNIRLYNTMQIMAAAWKSGTPAPVYDGDPNNPCGLPPSLSDLVE